MPFELPKTIEAAEDRRNWLVEEVQRLQEQLGDRERKDQTGKRLKSRDYWEWKKKATHVLNERLAELRAVKAMIAGGRRPSTAPTMSHLERCVRLLRDLQAQDVDFNELELAVIRDATEHLRTGGVEI